MTEEQISNIDPFLAQYRDSLKGAYESGMNTLNQTRQNQQAQIMSNANTRGMLYSNLPARSKVQYDTQTYLPAVANLGTTYQTARDSLRDKGVSLANQIKYYQEAIADMDKYASLYANA